MDDRGYFIVDGSYLFSSIHQIRKARPKFKDAKLNLAILSQALMRNWSLNIRSTIRTVYYFKKNDARLKSMLVVPRAEDPGKRDHWQVKECGQNIKSIPDSELNKIAAKYRDHFARSEKGLDIRLTCDVLISISSGRASNIVFLVNDRDYVPLFEAIQYLGGNVYLTALDNKQKIRKELAELADKFLTLDSELENIFEINKVLGQPEQQVLQQDQGNNLSKSGS